MYSLPSITCTMRPAVYLGVRCIQHSIVQQHLVVQLAQAKVHLQRLALLNRARGLNGQGLISAKQPRGARTPGDVCVAAVCDLSSEVQGHIGTSWRNSKVDSYACCDAHSNCEPLLYYGGGCCNGLRPGAQASKLPNLRGDCHYEPEQRTMSASGTSASLSPSRGAWIRLRTLATAHRKLADVNTAAGKADGLLSKRCCFSSSNLAAKKALWLQGVKRQMIAQHDIWKDKALQTRWQRNPLTCRTAATAAAGCPAQVPAPAQSTSKG